MLRICYYLGIKEKVLGPCLHALGSRSRSPYLLTYMHTCNAYRVCVCLSVCRLSSLSLCLARSVCYISLAYIPASFHSFLITSLLLHLSLSLRSLNNIHLYRKGSLATWRFAFWEWPASFSLRTNVRYERDTTSALLGHPKTDSEIPRQYLHREK